MSSYDEEVDLVVLGSGAAGLAAAARAHDLGLKALVLEKSDRYGGNTAMSGGVCWVGNNPHIHGVGIADNDDDVLSYLQHITGGEVAPERLRAYAQESKRVVTWLEEHTRVRFDALFHYTDYYPEAPGGRPGGRSMESRPFDGTELGDELRSLRMPHPQSQILGRFGITAAQAHTMLAGGIRAMLLMLVCFVRYALRWRARKRYGRDTLLACGNALIGRLRASLLDRGVEVRLNTGATELIMDGDRVAGVVVDHDGVQRRIGATRGVLLAAGGFSRNLEMRKQHQRDPITTEWTAGSPSNTGDGIRMGMAAGGSVALMDEAWWTPVTLVPRQEFAWVLVVEKNLPGGIFVNQHARRFTNEAAPYIDVVVGMYEDQAVTQATVPSYLIFDATYRRRYPVGPIAPGYAMPDSRVPRRYMKDFLVKASSLDELATKLELDPAALGETVSRYNEMSRRGVDEDFGRGESASDRYYGDTRAQPNPCMGPIETAPFYAIRVYPGDLGTKGGLVTDTASRVLSDNGAPIRGLFAAGNCAASVMGRTYPGAGGTIGPALTFGVVAAETAAAETEAGAANAA